MTIRLPTASTFALALALGCSSDPGVGKLAVHAYGEAFIEDGIPASETADGWAITFTTFVVNLSDIQAGNTDGEHALSLAGPVEVDLTTASNGLGQLLVDATDVAAGAWNDVSYRIAPGQNGYSVHAVGSATREGVTKTFDWKLESATHYVACRSTANVPDGGEATVQLTIHADHFFYDSLVSEDPGVRFQAYADADSDGDGAITRAELEAADIGTWDPGNSGITRLWPWLEAQSRTLGHIDGEGHCDTK